MPDMIDARFIILREDTRDGVTLAIVTSRVPPDSADEIGFRDALTSALTAWMQETDDGRAAWEASSHDFNVGDLATQVEGVTPDSLRLYLEARGIHDLSVSIIDENVPCHAWTYDTVLTDAEHIGGPVVWSNT
jgi:hypothetical protein